MLSETHDHLFQFNGAKRPKLFLVLDLSTGICCQTNLDQKPLSVRSNLDFYR